MRFLLASLAIVLNLLDNLTTYLCLNQPIPGFEVFEANPLAAWGFSAMGLQEGLLLESLVSTAAVLFLVVTRHVPLRGKLAVLGIMAALPAWAVANTLQVMREIGLSIPGF